MNKILIGLTLLILLMVGCGNNETQDSEIKLVEDDAKTQTESATETATESASEATASVATATESTATETTTDSTEDVEDKAQAQESNTDDLQDYIDLELLDMDGNSVKISDYEGKFIVLNFFGVWCHYCMEEMPDLQKVYSEYEGDDFVILLINATTTEKIGKDGVIEWYKKGLEVGGETIQITMPMVLDLDGVALATYPVSGFPTSYFINKEGKVLGAIPGMLDEATLLGILKDYNK